jgi:hypothetical protein
VLRIHEAGRSPDAEEEEEEECGVHEAKTRFKAWLVRQAVLKPEFHPNQYNIKNLTNTHRIRNLDNFK